MEATESKAKRQYVSDEESSMVDIISSLPDSILSHILSFLPTTKEAVQTSILAKRWIHVWTSVDRLKFDACYIYAKQRKKFIRFVYKVLKAYKGNIKEFSLKGYNDLGCTEIDATSWIDTAISRGVERLHFDFSFPDENPNWPLSIFTSKTLVDLEMWSLLGTNMDVPTTPIFPCLKKLKVGHSDRDFFKQIVARCSALEHVDVSLSGSPIDIVSSSMKRLDLLSNRRYGDEIVLCAPSLQYLDFCGALPIEFIAEGLLSSLIEADIFFREFHPCSRSEIVKEVRDSFERFIQTMANVKFLHVRFYGFKFFNSIGHGLFVNLTKLEIESAYFEWRLLLSFMESSINLEAISLRKTSALKKHKLAWKDPKKVPTCLSSSLRKISFDGYSEDELTMVKYVLRTAQVLEQVDIKCASSYTDNNDWKSDMLQNLQKLPRSCQRCEIFFV